MDGAFTVAVADSVHNLVEPLELLLFEIEKKPLLSSLFGFQAGGSDALHLLAQEQSGRAIAALSGRQYNHVV
jgi:hypothetical protein